LALSGAKGIPVPKATNRVSGKPCRSRKQAKPVEMPVFEPNAAGIDIGAREIYVAVPPERDAEPVRVFNTFTSDLR